MKKYALFNIQYYLVVRDILESINLQYFNVM